MSIFHVVWDMIFFKTVYSWHFLGDARSPDIKMASCHFYILKFLLCKNSSETLETAASMPPKAKKKSLKRHLTGFYDACLRLKACLSVMNFFMICYDWLCIIYISIINN
jgi:hypothetical protein